jgi:hypothetical protein
METTENLLGNELQVNPASEMHLKETAMWARFLGILGFIFSGLFVLVAFFAGTYLSRIMNVNPYGGYRNNPSTSMMGGFITFVYLFLAAFAFLVSLFTYRFGTRVKQAILQSDQESFNGGLMNLKFLFRFYGIIMIIYLGILALTLVVSIAGMAISK